MAYLKHVFIYFTMLTCSWGFAGEWFEHSHPLWHDDPVGIYERVHNIEQQLKDIEYILNEVFEKDDVKEIKYKINIIRLLMSGFETY